MSASGYVLKTDASYSSVYLVSDYDCCGNESRPRASVHASGSDPISGELVLKNKAIRI